MSKMNELVQEWREMGPIAWAEGIYGWIGPDGKSVTLELWQRAVLAAWWEHREIVSTLAVSNIKKDGKDVPKWAPSSLALVGLARGTLCSRK